MAVGLSAYRSMIYVPVMPHGERRRIVLWMMTRPGTEDGHGIGDFFILESLHPDDN
jgi:hypothetical protein